MSAHEQNRVTPRGGPLKFLNPRHPGLAATNFITHSITHELMSELTHEL